MARRNEAIGPLGVFRITVRISAMIALLLACLPLYYAARPFPPPNPWPRRFFAGLARVAGIRISTWGTRTGPGEFFLCNHVSWMDIPVLGACSGSAFIAHDGLTRFALLRWLCDLNETVFVARHDRRSVAAQVVQVREALREAGTLTIFPEGTTSDGTGVLPFKSSLLSALDSPPDGTAIQPVLLDYGKQSAELAWVGDDPGPANFLGILARRAPVHVTVAFLEPLYGGALANRKTIAMAAREAIVAELAKRRTC